jgi:TolB-like protein
VARARWWTAAVAAGCALAGVAAAAPEPPAAAPRATIAVLPLTNLSGTQDAAQLFGSLLTAALVERGPVVESGRVDAIMDSLRIRPTMSPDPEDVRAMKDALGVQYLVMGCVLEHGLVQTTEARYPCSGVVAKIVHVDSTRIAWAGSRYRCGDDKERLFGLGRDFDPVSVAMTLTRELADEIGRALWPTPDTNKGKSR